MQHYKKILWLVPLLLFCLIAAQDNETEGDTALLRQKAQRIMQDGNYKEAADIYKELALNPRNDPRQVGSDLRQALDCLQRVNRVGEVDELREGVVALHADNWRLLQSAAQSCFDGAHQGFIVAGEFQRGHHRGGGRYVNSIERDRVRALQLMQQALAVSMQEKDRKALADFHMEFARMVLGYRGYSEAWRLQYLTDLSELPDYEEGNRYYGRGGTQGAPVDPDGNPVFHRIPESLAVAASDGERWRWLLTEAVRLDPARDPDVLLAYANFLHQQFGVQTMVEYQSFLRQAEIKEGEPGPYAVHTLHRHETIARLATGVKRFALPEDGDFIQLFEKVAALSKGSAAETALDTLARIFENRRQYDSAVSYWQEAIKRFGAGTDDWRRKQLDQIAGNWCQFEPVMTHPAGKAASVEFLFRNGSKALFEAHAIDVPQLLSDVKAYLKSDPKRVDWQKINIGNIGYRLVQENERKYIGKQVAQWTLELNPRPNHFDRRITVETPLKEAGAYLLTARMQDGNTCKIVMWLDDTVLVRKNLDEQTWFFVADAVSGAPLPKINVEFFGYKQRYDRNKVGGDRYIVETSNFAEFSDGDGQVFPTKGHLARDFQWLISATTPAGRLAYLGFDGIWYAQRHDADYNATKGFMITDRPVYRPSQSVKFKYWIRHARYDQPDKSDFADTKFAVIITNPKQEKVFEKTFLTDAYGGLDGEFALPEDAALGQYYAYIWHNGKSLGGGNFRVEEYKKPEFEVTVEAPKEPIMLGEKITAVINAKYLFGAPVTKAKVKYKVLRTIQASEWYPIAPWDWFYGRGYWWFAYDYTWYPGWEEWGCKRPLGWWWPTRQDPPEVVAEAEVEIAADGTVSIQIDTALAKAMHGDQDHNYRITAEVTDESRRTIVGSGSVLVARQPFKVYAWVDRGHYRVGDVVRADFSARTLDGKPVQGSGALKLYRITYKQGLPIEDEVQAWPLDTDVEGRALQQLTASRAGQYRLSYTLTDSQKHSLEGAYVFSVMGEGADDKAFRFNAIELVPEKREYSPGEKVRLRINTAQADSTVVLFLRPSNGVYLPPEVIRVTGTSLLREVPVTMKDMPNFFIEAFTVSDGKLYSETREIVVPPEKRVLNVEVLPSSERYKPGAKAEVQVKLTDLKGNPFIGSTVLAVYDKAVEYISGGSNVGEIREFFWKWRRHHNPTTQSSLDRTFSNLTPPKEEGMRSLGVFGHMVDEEVMEQTKGLGVGNANAVRGRGMMMGAGQLRDGVPMMAMAAAPGTAGEDKAGFGAVMDRMEKADAAAAPAPETVEPAVRSNFADTAFWAGSLATDNAGVATVTFDMPENLTGWKIKTWAMGHGTVVGEGAVEVVTSKNLLLRLQAPRFFVEKDEVVLSANIHNYLETAKSVQAVLELDGGCLEAPLNAAQTVKIDAGGEKRVDWRITVVREGEAVVRMKALTDEESDAMQMNFPVYVHGMLKTESFCGVVRPDKTSASVTFKVPAERRIEQSRLELRYSPTLAGAMVDALPYLADYPYGCTEQTLNRFLPAVITQKIIKDMGIDLAAIKAKHTNLNAQELGDPQVRAAQWKRWEGNPVFDAAQIDDMVQQGLKRLTAMQLSDGGWGWFSGWGEQSSPHTTASVVHGLQVARDNGVALVPGVLESGAKWLQIYQREEIRKLENAPKQIKPWKAHADNMDAFAYMVLCDAGQDSADMRDFLYRDRNDLSVYAKAMLGLTFHKQKQTAKRDMLLRNIEQFLVEDAENQSAWLNLQNGGYWWSWYGSEYEAHAYYLKLLAAVEPRSERAAGLVKYLLNNRKHATYWNSTRDTALCIEAMADYLRASGEDKPDMTVEIYVDGVKKKEVTITADNMFEFDGEFTIEGKALAAGEHTIEVRRTGKGPVYFNAYLTNFTLEDFIRRAGLEVKVNRKYYKLVRVDQTAKVAGARGQALDQKIEKYERRELANLATLKSGELVEIELEIESKNDYEYLVFEDMKPAGFEPVEVRSGYQGRDLPAYMELRDERVAFFVRQLMRGRHSVSYRMRAEIPGRFSALPTRGYAMYAPELKANSDEIKLNVVD